MTIINTINTTNSPADILFNQLDTALSHTKISRIYLLVDPSIKPYFHDALDEKPEFQVPLQMYSGSMDDQFKPTLAELDTHNDLDREILQNSIQSALDELAPETLQQGQGRQICAWFISNYSVKQLARQLGRHTQQVDQDFDRVLFRLYDPRVLWLLWLVFDDRQKSILFDGITECWLLDPLGYWQVLRAEPLSKITALSDTSPFLKIQKEQWQAIHNFHLIHDVLRHHPELFADSTMTSLLHDCQKMHRLLMVGRSYGFNDASDLVRFAQHGIQYGEYFHQHPLLANRLILRQPDDFYAMLSDEITIVEWQTIQGNYMRGRGTETNYPSNKDNYK